MTTTALHIVKRHPAYLTSHLIMRQLFKFFEEYLPAFFLLIMTITIVCDVFGRYVFHHPVRGAPEIAGFLFVWLVFLSGAGSYRKNEHMRITSFTEKLGFKWRAAIEILINSAVFMISAYTAKLGWDLVVRSENRYMELLGIPYSIVYFSVPVCFILIAIHCIVRIFRIIKHGEKSFGTPAAHATDI